MTFSGVPFSAASEAAEADNPSANRIADTATSALGLVRGVDFTIMIILQ